MDVSGVITTCRCAYICPCDVYSPWTNQTLNIAALTLTSPPTPFPTPDSACVLNFTSRPHSLSPHASPRSEILSLLALFLFPAAPSSPPALTQPHRSPHNSPATTPSTTPRHEKNLEVAATPNHYLSCLFDSVIHDIACCCMLGLSAAGKARQGRAQLCPHKSKTNRHLPRQGQ